jgi:hypothetical protein
MSLTPSSHGPTSHGPTSHGPTSHDPAPPPSTRPLTWMVPDALLAEIEPEAQPLVRSAFLQRLQMAAAEREQPPEQRRCGPSPTRAQYLAGAEAQPTEPDKIDRAGLRYLLRWTLWGVVDTLEAGVLLPAGATYQPLLVWQCGQFGHVYKVMKDRMGLSLALIILHGELRLLRHRGSAVVEALLFA